MSCLKITYTCALNSMFLVMRIVLISCTTLTTWRLAIYVDMFFLDMARYIARCFNTYHRLYRYQLFYKVVVMSIRRCMHPAYRLRNLPSPHTYVFFWIQVSSLHKADLHYTIELPSKKSQLRCRNPTP